MERRSAEFVGYEMFDADGEIIAIGKENGLADVIEEGEKGYLVLSKTPFYGESGGQVGDKGIIKGENFEFKVTDTKKGVNGLHIHHGYMKSGLAEKGDHIHGMIDVQLRCDTAKNHTSTHLLHRALRNALGDHIEQAGSFVDEHRLRFDFNHYTAMTDDEIKRVEKEVNDVIMKALKVNVSIKTLDEAKEMGATALFGEKYGNEVRVVEVDDYSLELCGGTHISNSIEAGIFKILSETGVAAGVRRIEAITGREVYKLLNDNISLIDDLSQILKTNKKDVTSKAELIVDENKSLYKEIESLKNKEIDKMSKEILAGQTKVNEFNVITKRIDGLELDDVRNLGDKLIDKLENGILIFAITGEGKLTFLAMASKSAVEKGVHAGKLIKEIGKVAGGGGGGKPHMAQAGGKDLSKIDEAINHGIEIIKNI
jgi:alanyl-tRNA synthetase